MWLSARNYLAHLVARRPSGWYPLLGVFYLTHDCAWRCSYCCDGHGTPYYRLPTRTLPGSRVLEALARMRRYTDYLVLTGGEPLLHPDIDQILGELPRLGFDGVVLTTRGGDVAGRLDALDAALSHLVFSLDTLDPGRAEALCGRPGALEQVLGSIEAAAQRRPRRFEIVVSAVATPENLADLPGVYRFCDDRGFALAACPQLLGVKPHPKLFGNPDYRDFYELLIREKLRGRKVNGSVRYLEYMRDLRFFRCRPSTLLAVSPLAEVLYPCLEIGQIAGSLLDQPDLHALRRDARSRFGDEPRCDNRCHSACALGFSLALDAPWSAWREAVPVLRSWPRGEEGTRAH